MVFLATSLSKQAVKQPGKHEVRVCEAVPWKRKPSDAERHLVFLATSLSKQAVKQPEKHEVRVCEALIV